MCCIRYIAGCSLRKLLAALCVVLLFSVGAAAAGNVTFTLALKDGKTEYRSGEPIVLQLMFSAVEPGVQVNMTTTEPPSPIDTVVLTPTTNAFPWMEARARGNRYTPDFETMMPLQPGKPVTLHLALNDLYRFDAAGHYSVHVVTRRVYTGGGLTSNHVEELTSNEVSFDVSPFSEREEAELAASLEQRIRASTDKNSAERLASQLDYLPGDAATGVKLSLFLNPKSFYPFDVDVSTGLWIARNRSMVVEALERAIADPSQANGAGQNVLGTLVALKLSLLLPPDADRSASQTLQNQISAEYVHQIALSISKRTGTARIDAARTVFLRMARMGKAAGPDFEIAREVLITQFDEVNEYNVDSLLNSFGQYLQDARLVPSLRRVLENMSNPIFGGTRAAALKQLAKLAPDEVDKYVVREACAPAPMGFRAARDLSSAPVLPEVNNCLKEKLRMQTAGGQRNFDISTTLSYIARFADARLVPEVRAAYLARNEWPQDARGAAVAYLMRWAPKESSPLLEELLPEQNPELFYLLEAMHPPAEGLRTVFRQHLKTASAKNAVQYAYALAQIGAPEDRQFLRDELERLRQTRGASGFTADDGTLERELVSAILNGRTWKSTKEEVEELVKTCVSAQCKQGFPAQ